MYGGMVGRMGVGWVECVVRWCGMGRFGGAYKDRVCSQSEFLFSDISCFESPERIYRLEILPKVCLVHRNWG